MVEKTVSLSNKQSHGGKDNVVMEEMMSCWNRQRHFDGKYDVMKKSVTKEQVLHNWQNTILAYLNPLQNGIN